jgi:hypothetical protein
MAKDMPRIFYRYNGQWMRLSKLCGQLRKRPGKAKVLAGVVAEDKRLALVDTIMSVAIDWVQTGQRLFQSNNAVTAN